MKFSKTEIDLCKQIAEKYRKKIKVGDWIKSDIYKTPRLITFIAKDYVTLALLVPSGEQINEFPSELQKKYWFPLWTISDCLEWLRERKRIDGEIRLAYIDHHDKYFAHIFKEDASAIRTKIILVESGKTPLEALLKAVLAVLEQEGK